MIVIDTNIAIGLIIQNNVTIAEMLTEHTVLAPAYIKIELLNVLRKYHVSHKVPVKIIDRIYDDFIEITDEFIPDEVLLKSAKEISFLHNHPIYDCLFLALAQQFGAAFMSFDKRLLNKAIKMGIKTIAI